MLSSRGSSQPRDWTQVFLIAGRFFTIWATWETKNTGVGSLSLLQGNFPTQESIRSLLHCSWILYQLSYPESPISGLLHSEYSFCSYSILFHVCAKSLSVVLDSLQPTGLWPPRFLYPRDFSGKNIGVGCHTLLQGIFLSQGVHPHLQLLHCRWILYHWDTREAHCFMFLQSVFYSLPLCIIPLKVYAGICLSFTCQWIFKLFHIFGLYQESFCEHSFINIYVEILFYFFFLGEYTWNITGSLLYFQGTLILFSKMVVPLSHDNFSYNLLGNRI